MRMTAKGLGLGLLLLAGNAAGDADVKRLPSPDFRSKSVSTVPASPLVTLRLVSDTANSITDDDEWFGKNRVLRNEVTERPEGLPSSLAGVQFLRAIRSGDRFLGLYGPDHAGASVVAGLNDEGTIEYAFDFSEYRLAPRNVQADLDYVEQRVLWAEQRGDVLYVAHGHHTYAASSHGMNGYVTAIDVKTGKALWHSAPLVSNAANFAFLGDDVLATGYGFTAEPDFVYLLRAKDGAAIAKIAVKSGPSWLFLREDRLYVRTYNRDYVFAVVGKP